MQRNKVIGILKAVKTSSSKT